MGAWDALKCIFGIKIEKLQIFSLFWVYQKGDIDMDVAKADVDKWVKVLTQSGKIFKSDRIWFKLPADIFMASWDLLVAQKS